ncbi:MAG: PIN/TRAM domain-containing protein [Bacillota bacterium]|jgi:uncharacterized protein YacL
MLVRITRILIGVLGLMLGYQLTDHFSPLIAEYIVSWTPPLTLSLNILGAVILGLIFYLISPGVIRWVGQLSSLMETHVQKVPTQDIVIGTVGLIVGLIIANLLGFALMGIPLIGSYLPIASNVLFGYLGVNVAIKKREELGTILSFPSRASKSSRRDVYKVLDTSVIIDGRIADVAKAGFLEGILIVPNFVLEELRHIADSADATRRNRGRRGLDVLNQIQKELGLNVQIVDRDFEDVLEVDSKLIRLAQTINAKILTTDYNLNKVCELQGVPVLNVNELANAVKPVVLPGEEMVVSVMKEGKEFNQGVAYLDDGTMIVVDNGRRHIGEKLAVVVTSVLQTSAGRMIFARVR